MPPSRWDGSAGEDVVAPLVVALYRVLVPYTKNNPRTTNVMCPGLGSVEQKTSGSCTPAVGSHPQCADVALPTITMSCNHPDARRVLEHAPCCAGNSDSTSSPQPPPGLVGCFSDGPVCVEFGWVGSQHRQPYLFDGRPLVRGEAPENVRSAHSNRVGPM